MENILTLNKSDLKSLKREMFSDPLLIFSNINKKTMFEIFCIVFKKDIKYLEKDFQFNLILNNKGKITTKIEIIHKSRKKLSLEMVQEFVISTKPILKIKINGKIRKKINNEKFFLLYLNNLIKDKKDHQKTRH